MSQFFHVWSQMHNVGSFGNTTHVPLIGNFIPHLQHIPVNIIVLALLIDLPNANYAIQ
jgi:hypothetical protein